MDPETQAFGTQSPDIEPGMNIISADFDLIMVNRPNERLYGKPIVELLGKKCYREFEKRDEPCAHCPGRRSLLTGDTHEAETDGLRDDGTWFSARVRTFPLQGLGDVPTGFVEVVEDITEEKRAEKLGRIEAGLRAALAPVQNVHKALTLTFEAALRVESVDGGCIFMLRGTAREPDLVVSRGLSEGCVRTLVLRAADPQSEIPLAGLTDAPRSLATIPIQHRGEVIAVLVAASSTYPAIPPTLLAGLHSLAATVAGAIGRIWAEQSRGDAVADLEAIITHAPVASFILDPVGRVTMWNRAAEHLFGWRASEVVKRPCPFPQLLAQTLRDVRSPLVEEAVLEGKDGSRVDVRLTVAPFRDVVGVASTVIVMVDDLTPARRLLDLEARLRDSATRLAALEDRPGEKPPAGEADLLGEAEAGAGAAAAAATRTRTGGATAAGTDARSGAAIAGATGTRVLLLAGDDDPLDGLASILHSLGHEATICRSLPDAVAGIATAAREARPFALAVVELVASDGSSGLALMAALRSAGLDAPVMVSSDSEVRGYREHGFAAVLKRPYVDEEVRRALEDAPTTRPGGTA